MCYCYLYRYVLRRRPEAVRWSIEHERHGYGYNDQCVRIHTLKTIPSYPSKLEIRRLQLL